MKTLCPSRRRNIMTSWPLLRTVGSVSYRHRHYTGTFPLHSPRGASEPKRARKFKWESKVVEVGHGDSFLPVRSPRSVQWKDSFVQFVHSFILVTSHHSASASESTRPVRSFVNEEKGTRGGSEPIFTTTDFNTLLLLSKSIKIIIPFCWLILFLQQQYPIIVITGCIKQLKVSFSPLY